MSVLSAALGLTGTRLLLAQTTRTDGGLPEALGAARGAVPPSRGPSGTVMVQCAQVLF